MASQARNNVTNLRPLTNLYPYGFKKTPESNSTNPPSEPGTQTLDKNATSDAVIGNRSRNTTPG